jgi:two-component system phosphate regulon sensor histidine kinase PhoR
MMKMESLNKLRNDFISNISHELKTPLSTVTVALEVLKSYDKMNDRKTTDEYLNIAIGEMKRLDQLVNKVLSTSRLENQDQYIQLEEGDLVRVTTEALNSMQARFVQQNAVVNFESDNESSVLLIDKLHIHGVLINLLDNSLKYCNERPAITIRIDEKPGSVILSILDNGPGIPEEYISRVFDKFFRVPDGDKHNIKGYGLGLSFSDLVMKQHGGSINARNIKEGGTIFTLTFPKTKR